VSSFLPGCFGRLPDEAESLPPREDDPDLRALQSALPAAGPLRFLRRSPKTGRLYAGVLLDGPGVIFGRLDIRLGEIDPSLLPLLASPFLERAEGVRRLRDLDALAGPLVVEEARRACLAYVAGTSGSAFWTGMFGSADDPRRHALVRILAKAAAAGRAVRLPRGTGGDAEVCFWLELVRRFRRSPDLPVLTTWSARGLTLAFDGLPPVDAEAEAGRLPFDVPHPALQDDGDAPLSKLLQRLSAR
jgi:hypothetical protein